MRERIRIDEMLRVVLRPDVPRPRPVVTRRTPPEAALEIENDHGSHNDEGNGEPWPSISLGIERKELVIVRRMQAANFFASLASFA